MPVIECVPNVSEGRRMEVIDALTAAVQRVGGVRLLDRSSDPSHNRSVFTLVGDAAALEQAVLALFEGALAAIDLRTHSGAHPRLGAVDVVPFVPIEAATMEDCVALAKTTGAEVAARFQVPVYLYEDAAPDPRRRNLADIRRGEFEGLAGKIVRPEWAPDYGPRRPHPTAGATVIGARPPLIAFNVDLATDRLDVAQAIARAVRHSSGGLPNVKALGLVLPHRGIAQVSMNLTNYATTPIIRAFEAVREAAARLGVETLASEIVGLVPAAALPPDPEQALKLAGFHRGQVLEERLRRSRE